MKTESIDTIAARAGVSPRRLDSILGGGQDVVSLVTADRVCVALGTTLSLVYPEAA
jgi:hypothetical protein